MRGCVYWYEGLRWFAVAGIIAVDQHGGLPMRSIASDRPARDWAQHRQGPVESRSVYWVGHSLMEAKARVGDETIDLMSMVGKLAGSAALDYSMGDHTLWGSSLSALWRGRPHSYTRDASLMIEKRETFERDAGRYDTLVLTEGIPLGPTFEAEFSSYYVRRFFCAIKRANPAARVYLYQTWLHLHGSDRQGNYGPVDKFDWRGAMVAQRAEWELLSEMSSTPSVRAPGGWLSRLGISDTSDGGCKTDEPIFVIPVGNVLVALADRLAAPRPGDDFAKRGGDKLTIGDVFSNAYVDWPKEWPSNEKSDPAATRSRLAGLRRGDPSRPVDDIHPSAVGIYVSALVHFAVIYRRSPVGLPPPAFLPGGLAKTLQCIVWETVVTDAKAGVGGVAGC